MGVVVEDQVQTRLEDVDIVLEQQEKRFPKLSKSSWHLILWPILLTPLFFSSSSQTRVIGCTALMAIWWATEAIPLPATALLPLALFPLLAIREASAVAPNYFKNTSALFLGGFIVAAAIEKSGLHRRIALRVLMTVGTSPDRMLIGFMLVCWGLSMWMSNTATCVMMTPIIETVLQSIEAAETNPSDLEPPSPRERSSSHSAMGSMVEHNPVVELNTLDPGMPAAASPHSRIPTTPWSPRHGTPLEGTLDSPRSSVPLRDRNSDMHKFGRQLCLGVAYACSVGGFATLTGTGPNIVLSGQFSLLFPKAPELSFAVWFMYGLPLSFGCLGITFVVVRLHGRWKRWGIRRPLSIPTISEQEVLSLYRDLGPVRWDEMLVMIAFGVLVSMWIFRDPQVIPGWGNLYEKGMVSDTTSVMFIVIVLFLAPASRPDFSSTEMTPKILEWGDMAKLPWGIVLLLGGGFALADAFKATGLSDSMSEHMDALEGLPIPLLMLTLCACITMATELTSNVSTCTIMLPVLAALAQALRVNPLVLMLPGTVSCSLAFMLPVATPPNAIVFATGRLKVRHMAGAGVMLNLLGVFMITCSMLTLGLLVFSIDINSFPCWAEPVDSAAYLACEER